MITYGSQSGKPTYRLDYLFLDTPADMAELTTDHAVGSTAYIIETSQTYKLNSRGQWILQKTGSGPSPDPDHYDGGDIDEANNNNNNHFDGGEI